MLNVISLENRESRDKRRPESFLRCGRWTAQKKESCFWFIILLLVAEDLTIVLPLMLLRNESLEADAD